MLVLNGNYSNTYKGPQEISYLFVDAGSLRAMVENASKELYDKNLTLKDIDFSKLSQGFTKTFYYDALPPKNGEEKEDEYDKRIEPDEALLDKLSQLTGFHVFQGTARKRRKRGVEQKQVDIMIAVHMLSHSHRRNMHKATLLTTDLDFKPLIDALVQDGMYVSLWYTKDETNKELIYAADESKALDFQAIHSFANDEFIKTFGFPQARCGSKEVHTTSTHKKHWKTASGIDVDLFFNGTTHTLAFPSKEHRTANNYVYITHVKEDYIKRYAKEKYNVEWYDVAQ